MHREKEVFAGLHLGELDAPSILRIVATNVESADIMLATAVAVEGVQGLIQDQGPALVTVIAGTDQGVLQRVAPGLVESALHPALVLDLSLAGSRSQDPDLLAGPALVMPKIATVIYERYETSHQQHTWLSQSLMLFTSNLVFTSNCIF